MFAYNPNPANDPAEPNLMDDSDTPNASNWNPGIESISDTTAYLRSRVNQASNNWPLGIQAWAGAQVSGASLILGVPPVWDACYGRWLASFTDSATDFYLQQSYTGYDWNTLYIYSYISHIFTPYGLVTRSTDGQVLSIGLDATLSQEETDIITPTSIQKYVTSTGYTQPWTTPGSGDWYSGNWNVLSSVWVVWLGGSTTFVPHYSANGYQWTAATTWSPPASFKVHNTAHFSNAAVGLGATLYTCIFPAGTSPVTEFMVTSDGENWSQETMPTLNAGESVVDAAFDAFTGTIYLLTGTASLTRLWYSTVLGVWNLVSTTIAHQAYALRANGRELVCWVQFGAQGTGFAAAYRALTSVNAGASWQIDSIGTTTAPSTLMCLKANGSQFIYVNTDEYSSSAIVGVPPTQTV